MKSISIYTELIDDFEGGINELKSQLEGFKLQKNTVGIIQCDPEFIESDFVAAVYKEFGFPLVGGTTVSIATNNHMGNMMFSVLILTGDDVEFTVASTDGISDDSFYSIRESVKDMVKLSSLPLKMVMMFPTVTNNLKTPGDMFLRAIETVSSTVPIFGTFTVNDGLKVFERSMSVINDTACKEEMSYLLIHGNVNPRFFIATVPKESNIAGEDAVITRVDGQAIAEINNLPAVNHFEKFNLAEDGKLAKGTYFIPILLKGKDIDRPYVRALIDFNEHGHAVCRGNIPRNSTIDFGSLQSADILEATKEVMENIKKDENINAILIFSCIIRQLNIGTDILKELSVIQEVLSSKAPLLASYSGGEFAPIEGNDGVLSNEFHNYSLVACVM